MKDNIAFNNNIDVAWKLLEEQPKWMIMLGKANILSAMNIVSNTKRCWDLFDAKCEYLSPFIVWFPETSPNVGTGFFFYMFEMNYSDTF